MGLPNTLNIHPKNIKLHLAVLQSIEIHLKVNKTSYRYDKTKTHKIEYTKILRFPIR